MIVFNAFHWVLYVLVTIILIVCALAAVGTLTDYYRARKRGREKLQQAADELGTLLQGVDDGVLSPNEARSHQGLAIVPLADDPVDQSMKDWWVNHKHHFQIKIRGIGTILFQCTHEFCAKGVAVEKKMIYELMTGELKQLPPDVFHREEFGRYFGRKADLGRPVPTSGNSDEGDA